MRFASYLLIKVISRYSFVSSWTIPFLSLSLSLSLTKADNLNDTLNDEAVQFHRSLAITSRPTRRRRPTKNPNAKTRAPTRKVIPSSIPKPSRQPTRSFVCSEASSKLESLKIACEFFQISNLQDCQSRKFLINESVEGTIPIEVGLLSQSTSLTFSVGSGTIPTTISCLTKLQFFKIGSSEIIGTLPEFSFQLDKIDLPRDFWYGNERSYSRNLFKYGFYAWSSHPQ